MTPPANLDLDQPPLPTPAAPALWRAFAETAPFYVALLSTDGRIVYLNRSKSRSPAEYHGRSITEFAPPGWDPREKVEQVVATGQPCEFEIPLTGGGTTRWLQCHLAPFRNPDGAVAGLLAIGQDVSEAKQAGIELRMSVNALHRMVESREQLAADLHDGILQSLYGVGLRLEAARAASGAVTDGVATHLNRAIAQLNETMAEVRRYLTIERASAPMGHNWLDAIAGVLRGLEVADGPSLSVVAQPATAERVPIEFRNELLFIAREAVSNAVRHAGAGRVTVRLLGDEGRLSLEIEDNGRGFSTDENSGGRGILSMTRRASQISAQLAIHSTPGRGTLVRLDLPNVAPSRT